MRKYVFLLITLVFSPCLNAQIFKKIQEKAARSMERALERKTDEKIDRTTEAIADSIFAATTIKKGNNSDSNKELGNGQNSPLEFPGNILIPGGKDVSYESRYVFPVTATIDVEDLNANVKKTRMKQGYGKQALITELEGKGDPFIIDMKNQTAIMLNINKGTAQVMSLEWMERVMGNKNVTAEDKDEVVPKVNKTGKTKTLNGYTCHEYDIISEDGRINAWFAPDVKFDYQDYLRGMAKLFSKRKEVSPVHLLNDSYGYVMEMTFYNKQNVRRNSMKVIALSEKVRMVAMSNFKVMKI